MILYSAKVKISCKLQSEYAGLGHFTAESLRARQDDPIIAKQLTSIPHVTETSHITAKEKTKPLSLPVMEESSVTPENSIVDKAGIEIVNEDRIEKLVDQASVRSVQDAEYCFKRLMEKSNCVAIKCRTLTSQLFFAL